MNIRTTEEEITQTRTGSICYMCRTAISQKPSREHIIPHSLGSNLISRSILCETCNNSLGSDIDSNLTKNMLLHHYMSGDLQASARYTNLTRLDGTPYQLQKLNIGDIKKPKIIVSDSSMQIQVPSKWSEKQAEAWLKPELVRRGLSLKNIAWDKKEANKTMLNPQHSTTPFIDQETVPGMIKIGCNWWAAVCDHPIPDVLRECILDGELPLDWRYRSMGYPAYHYQYHVQQLSQVLPGYHTLTAVGDHNNGLGYVDVNLFGVQTFRVIIDFGYTSTPFAMKVSMKAFDNKSREYSSRSVPRISRKDIVNRRLWINKLCAKPYHDQLMKFADAYGMNIKEFEEPISRHIDWSSN